MYTESPQQNKFAGLFIRNLKHMEETIEQTVAETEEKAVEQEQEQEQTYTESAVAVIKEGYELKLAKQKAEADKAIKERDEVIKQLLSGDGTATKPLGIVDKINAKRNYKKW